MGRTVCCTEMSLIANSSTFTAKNRDEKMLARLMPLLYAFYPAKKQ